ncbi:WD40-repeat-containing domain protein [Scheffersomyces amazonensis]|uniref:WD40-repeat-containing domain protein n=1 Tax=Scheffersomyces amazonensis TaxID=1078765 RepID=UPI00315CBB8F
MDRQALLEEKRRRVQELKQRKLNNSLNDTTSVDHILGSILKPSQSKNQVSIGIQVNTNSVEQSANGYVQIKTSTEKELATYDKAVQTNDIEHANKEEEEEEEEVVQVEDKDEDKAVQEESSKKHEVEPVLESDLNSSLIESLKLINKIHVSGSFDVNQFSYRRSTTQDSSPQLTTANVPIIKILEFNNKDNRRITCINVSPHDSNLVVVAYANETSSIPTGQAIIYSINSTNVFPEYYLSCSSPISYIEFDKMKRDRIIGGLADGKIVIWDYSTSTSKLILTPQLSSPAYSNIILTNQKIPDQVKFRPHKLPVTKILQLKIDTNDCILTFSEDGLINIWSSNLLATPKFDTIQVFKPSNDDEFQTNSKLPIPISDVDLVGGDANYLLGDSKTLPFLNSLIISNHSRNYRIDASDTKFITAIPFNTPQGVLPITVLKTSIISCGSNGSKYIISSYSDWSLKIWDFNNFNKPVIEIPTKSFISDLAVSPTNSSQIITTTNINGSSQIQFWDLNVKLFSPQFEKEVGDQGDIITSITFAKDGMVVLLGFSSGRTEVWNVEQDYIHHNRNTIDELDNGLPGYLSRKKLI